MYDISFVIAFFIADLFVHSPVPLLMYSNAKSYTCLLYTSIGLKHVIHLFENTLPFYYETIHRIY